MDRKTHARNAKFTPLQIVQVAPGPWRGSVGQTGQVVISMDGDPPPQKGCVWVAWDNGDPWSWTDVKILRRIT